MVVGMNIPCLEGQSTITRIELEPEGIRRVSMKSMEMEFQGCSCYNSFTYFSPLIFLIYSLHAPTSCLLFLVYILISFYRLSFLSCTALLFMHSLMHSTITHAQSAY